MCLVGKQCGCSNRGSPRPNDGDATIGADGARASETARPRFRNDARVGAPALQRMHRATSTSFAPKNIASNTISVTTNVTARVRSSRNSRLDTCFASDTRAVFYVHHQLRVSMLERIRSTRPAAAPFECELHARGESFSSTASGHASVRECCRRGASVASHGAARKPATSVNRWCCAARRTSDSGPRDDQSSPDDRSLARLP